MALNDRKVIARRAAMELERILWSISASVCPKVLPVLPQKRRRERFDYTHYGAWNLWRCTSERTGFATALQCRSDHRTISINSIFTMGRTRSAFLGLAQTDCKGNLNVSKFGEKVVGPGVLSTSVRILKGGLLRNIYSKWFENGNLRRKN